MYTLWRSAKNMMHLWKLPENKNIPGYSVAVDPPTMLETFNRLRKYGKVSLNLKETTNEVAALACDRSDFVSFSKLKLISSANPSFTEEGGILTLEVHNDEISQIEELFNCSEIESSDFGFKLGGTSVWFW